MTIHVQFETSAESNIISYFDSPQDSTLWANTGEVVVDDARWIAYYDTLPGAVKQHLPAPSVAV